MRIVKAPDVRRAEILAMANQLFQTSGYSKTSVDQIVRQLGIAKGTFYHYFSSKQAILEALAEQLVAELAAEAQTIVARTDLNATDKMVAIIRQQNQLTGEQSSMVNGLHLPENKELHERVNIEIVRVLGAVLAQVVEQGNQEKRFQVIDPLSTVQFILAGSLFLLGDGTFNWSAEEQLVKTRAMVVLIERALAAQTNSLLAMFMDNAD